MNRLKLVLAWLLVVVPLGWGVTRSVQKAIPLFTAKTSLPSPRP